MRAFWAELKHTLRRLRGQTLGWGIGLALYGLLMGYMYDTIKAIEGLDAMIASYPPELLAFFGDVLSIRTPAGFISVYYTSYIPLIIGIFAVSAAAGLIAGDEERGTLDLIMAHPIGRTALYWARALGFAVSLALVLLLGYLGWLVTLPSSNMDINALQLLWPFVPIFSLLLLFGALALFLSMLLPSSRLAAMTAGGLLVANFLLLGLANLNADLKAVMDLTPFAFMQDGDAIDGLRWDWIAGLLAVAVALAAGGWLLFRRRDIRVGGERSWTLRQRRAQA
jgi:ABC-2 type transport system permease protein